MKGAIIRKSITFPTAGFSMKEIIKPIFSPIIFGIYGFSFLFAFLILGKFISYIIGNSATFSVDLQIVATAISGFVLFYLIKLIELIRGRKY
ncbi:MAG: hypothetical protein IPJ03_12735 [Ignavibacteriales bacterium]|nr:hypothetical protein [Ignavibacteriales bacterium]